jgi:hypothetical protein
MSDRYIEYTLHDGYIDNWLVAGPQDASIPAPEEGTDRAEFARRFYRRISEIHEQPVELGTFQSGEAELAWRYVKCLDDHYVDLSAFYPTWHYLRSWAYAQVMSPTDQDAILVLTANGPADVWVDRRHIHRQEGPQLQEPRSSSVHCVLHEGLNEVLVRFEAAAARACSYAMALRLVDLPTDELVVRLPTWHTNTVGRQRLERVYQEVHLEQDVITPDETPYVRWDDELEDTDNIDFWLQDWREHIQVAGSLETQPGARRSLGYRQLILEEGPHRIALTPPNHVILRDGIRYQEYRPFYVLETTYADAPYGTYDERRKEALQYASRREGDLYGDIATLSLGQWPSRTSRAIEEAIDKIARREDGSVSCMVGLLGMVYRYLDSRYFTAELKSVLEQCVLGFKYWHDEPGADAMCYAAESHSILFHTCETLAGQRFPARVFANTGQTGHWHREKGERLALDWLHSRGTRGFSEWDSNCSFDQDLLALSHLHDLAENETVRELAAVVMDKLLFTMAVNSFKGTFGSTHGCTNAPMIRGGQLEATSGISRLLFGLGVWNEHIGGLVALACSQYELPPILPAIAADSSELWQAEQHPGVNKVTYRTADYMLCSAQDHRPGEKGDQQHIWQATLGPDAVVFATHPPCVSETDARRPNFWRGNTILPRVAQWKDVLIAIHNLPDDDWMGFTHAYWPVYAFDEQAVEDGWAFARVGDGYLALTAAQGLSLVTRGPSAYRELRSYGQHNTWFCHLGRAETDGSFADFCRSVRALDVSLDGLAVTCRTLRGQALSFAWEGPLLVEGEAQPLSGFRHYDGPFCSADPGDPQIDINYAGYTLQLDFGLPGTEDST